jgi:predicted ribosome quality control (RQC) complex YloA/Tae2 family protein
VAAAAVAEERPAGGWAFYNDYQAELQRRRRRERDRQRLEEETEQIQDELDRAIAQELRKQERLDDKRKDYERLAELAKANADLEAARQYSERVATAYARAIEKGTYSALEALDRELQRANEDEEFLVTAVLMLVH